MQSSSSDNCICHYNIKILNLFDPELQLINTKPIIKNKLEELFKGVEKVKSSVNISLRVQEKNDHKIFHSSAKLIASNSDNDEAFKSMHKSIMTKTKNSASEDWAVEATDEHSFKIFECYYKQK